MPTRANASDHERLWAAIDAIAAHHGLSRSALARRAGLDPSAFNKSKRVTVDGRPRWPSTESIAKILEATGAGLVDFLRLIAGPQVDLAAACAALPVVAPGGGERPGFAEDGGAASTPFPGGEAEPFFTFEVADEASLPLYRPGDVLIASGIAPIRAGDRVLVHTCDGRIGVAVFAARSRCTYTLAAVTPPGEGLRLAATEVLWIARILWASQ